MGIVKRTLGYAALGATKETARRAWESRDVVESSILAAQTGVLGEIARDLLRGEFDPREERSKSPSPSRAR